MKFLDYAFMKLIEVGGQFLLVGITMAVVLQIISRSFFGSPFSWPEELSVFLFIYLVFIGGLYLTGKRGHIIISFFIDRMPAYLKYSMTFASHLLVLLHLSILLWSIVPLSEGLAKSRSPALEWPLLIFFAVVPFSAAGMLFIYFFQTIKGIRTWISKFGEREVSE